MAPRVHTIKKTPPSAPAAAPAEEPPVATTVTLDEIDVEDGDTASGDGPTTEDDFEDNDPDEPKLKTAPDGEVDDEDLSLLEDDEQIGGNSTTDATVEEQPEEGFLEIYREECLQCRELVPMAAKSFKKKGCHFTSGNKHCPAESTSIVMRVPLEEIVPRWIAAEKSRDFGKLSRLTAKLAEKPDWFQQRVAQAVEKARKGS